MCECAICRKRDNDATCNSNNNNFGNNLVKRAWIRSGLKHFIQEDTINIFVLRCELCCLDIEL